MTDSMSRLQTEWPAWKIWRGRRSTDPDGVRLGDWIATRLDAAAGTDPTVMTDTADQLDEALKRQKEAALAVRRLVAALHGRNVIAEPTGDQVRVTHPASGRGDVVTVGFSERWRCLAWYWKRDDDAGLIGPADGLELVTGRIVDAICGPRVGSARAGRRARP